MKHGANLLSPLFRKVSMNNSTLIQKLEQHAYALRIDSIRATTASKSGHPTSCLSAAELISTLFFHTLRFDSANPYAANNDRFILSKGHAIPVVYAAWKQLGIISDAELLSLRKVDSPLEGHPTPRFAYNEAATGSLGQGLGIGVGMALNARLQKNSYTTFVMMGDGEITEGSIWEAADLASHYKLTNLVGIIDCNHFGQSESTLNGHDAEKIAAKFTAFGWHSIVVDGHSIDAILNALDQRSTTHPTVIVAKTYKGYGLEAIENKNGFHGKPFKEDELASVFAALAKRFPAQAGASFSQPSLVNRTKEQSLHNATPKVDTDKLTALCSKNPTMAPRKAYGYALAHMGSSNEKLVVLDADVKNSTFSELFQDQHPDRFFQCFIAEQNMVSVATGLTLRGNIAFSATFGAFFTRAHDQIRMAAIGRVPLRLCGSHCGVSIGEDGPSQMALEDIAMMRSIPHSIVLYPSDGVSAYALTTLMTGYNEGISYLRTTRETLPTLYKPTDEFTIGGCKVLKESVHDKACIITAGITVHEALKAYETLKKRGILISIIDLYSVKPFDEETVCRVVHASNGAAIVVEDHYAQGGIGEAIASLCYNEGFDLEHLAVQELSRSGSPSELMALAGIDAAAIVACVETFVKKH